MFSRIYVTFFCSVIGLFCVVFVGAVVYYNVINRPRSTVVDEKRWSAEIKRGINNVKYVRDPRSNLCFIFSEGSDGRIGVQGVVPIESVPEDLLVEASSGK